MSILCSTVRDLSRFLLQCHDVTMWDFRDGPPDPDPVPVPVLVPGLGVARVVPGELCHVCILSSFERGTLYGSREVSPAVGWSKGELSGGQEALGYKETTFRMDLQKLQ